MREENAEMSPRKERGNALKVMMPAIIYMCFFMVLFFLLKRIRFPVYHYPYMAIDLQIPYVRYFIIPYVFWFLWVPFTLIYLGVTDAPSFRKVSWLMMAGMTIYLLACVVYPTKLSLRPAALPGNDIFCRMTSFIYGLSPEMHVFPSLHVFDSCIALHAVLAGKGKLFQKKSFKIFAWITTVLICLSAVLIRQHSLIDIVGGVLLYLLTLVLLKKRRTD